ncbi:NB-ARC domain-containing protein [Evansella tamaricis]|uniref:NB-ARC domain-containing protein n=1 Tax=Evansella tamaricis TaxID=2069301 RepID=A0ABS6JJJ5_9BACI|nr:NB-ARC domain-containing protein [Evansella tamaricis]MBU9713852.1 hypothetical protein [Evansella tamaricis]
MDFIRKKLDNKIHRNRLSGRSADAAELYRVKIEYLLTLIFAYLWNKNSERINAESKKEILEGERPSMGHLVGFIRHLDVDEEFSDFIKVFGSKKSYTNFRNKTIGHGYRFDSDLFMDDISTIYEQIQNLNNPFISRKIRMVTIENYVDSNSIGTAFSADSLEPEFFSMKDESQSLKINNTYIQYEDEYYRITPFIQIKDEESIYMYCNYNRISGTFVYNQLFAYNAQITMTWGEFKSVELHRTKNLRTSLNGTISNVYENNYDKDSYIEISNEYINKINDFLLSNQSNACCTIWGFGGVGKTATVQYVCDQLRNRKTAQFQFIIFISAKDRQFNPVKLKGEIEPTTDRVETFEEIIKQINLIMNDNETFDVEEVMNVKEKFLLVIDDFETLERSEQKKVIEFTKRLNVSTQKLIITTRSSHIIGEEILMDELNKEDTCAFLYDVIKREHKNYVFQLDNLYADEENKRKIHQVTSGRPLFILHLAYILPQKGQEILNESLLNGQSASEFLFGRLFDYIVDPVKETLACLVFSCSSNSLTGELELVKLLKYNDSNELDYEYEFDDHLNILKKYKLISVNKDLDTFSITSKEIRMRVEDKILPYLNNLDEKKKVLLKGIKEYLPTSISVEDAWSKYLKDQEEYQSVEDIELSYNRLLTRRGIPVGTRLRSLTNYYNYLKTQNRQNRSLDMLNKVESYFEDPTYFPYYILKAQIIAEVKKDTKEALILIKKQVDKQPSTKDYLLLCSELIYYVIEDVAKMAEEAHVKYNETGEITRNEYKKLEEEYKKEFQYLMETLSTILTEYLSTVKDSIGEEYSESFRRLKKNTRKLVMFLRGTNIFPEEEKQKSISFVTEFFETIDYLLDEYFISN